MLIVLPDELEKLRSMQPLDRDVFNYLAERVDYESGMIGQARRISYGGMAYDLSEHEVERRSIDKIRTVTSKQIENSVSRLVNAGLLDRQSKSGFNQRLLLVRVFWAAALGKGYCDQKPDGSQLGVLLGVLNNLSSHNINELEENIKASWEAKSEPVGTTSITQHTTYRDDEFSMTMDWQPTDSEFEMALHRAGFSADKVERVWVVEFVSFWALEKNRGRKYTQQGWTTKLALAMLDYLRQPGLFERRRGITPPAKASASSGHQGRPDWAVMPREDDALQTWAMRHGYGEAPMGASYLQYRNILRNKVENRLTEWRRLS